jgi:hypothetical protein
LSAYSVSTSRGRPRVELHLSEGREHARQPRGIDFDPGERVGRKPQRVVTGEDRRRVADALGSKAFAQMLVYGGPAAAHAIAVHPVVVDQEVRLHQFDGDAGVERRLQLRGGACRAAADHHQRRAQPLSAAHAQVAHCPDHLDHLAAVVASTVHRGVEKTVQPRVDFGFDRRDQREKGVFSHRLRAQPEPARDRAASFGGSARSRRHFRAEPNTGQGLGVRG